MKPQQYADALGFPTERPRQLSIIEGMERPVGRILPSVFTGSNSDLMAAVAPLYLTGSVLDVTYGNGDTAGGWWRKFTPDPFTFHDLALDGVDFTDLPHGDGSFEAVTFDPPYVISGGTESTTAGDFLQRFGIGDRSAPDFYGLLVAGFAEVCRVSHRWVLVKCMEFAQGGRFHDIPYLFTAQALERGFVKHDLIVHHTGPGPGSHNIDKVRRARRAHSYLLVFEVGRATREVSDG